MLTLITGQPGAGKTLYALNFVKTRAEKENRPVYYSGINDLKLPWFELDKGEDWHTVPEGSIVVIDECQRIFRPRGNGTAVPEHVSKLETHRHSGVDLVLITQHPMLADTNVRRLVGQHFHVVRAFGTKKATVHEWQEVKNECDKSRSDSIRHDFFYPKDSFAWYKSAEIHTHKARIPMRVFFLFALPLILGALIWAVVKFWHMPGTTSVPAAQGILGANSGSPQQQKIKTPQQFVAERQARVAGLAYTAPIYDEVTRPVDAPFPAACMASKSSCKCFSQQATALDVSKELCMAIVERGFFKDWQSKESARSVAQYKTPSTSNPAPQARDIDRTEKYLTIDAPPPLRASPGFGASDPFVDKKIEPSPDSGRPAGIPRVNGVPKVVAGA